MAAQKKSRKAGSTTAGTGAPPKRTGARKPKPAGVRKRRTAAGSAPEGTLRQFEQIFQVLLESTSVVFFATDAQGLLTYISPSIAPIIGYPPARIIGRHFSDFIHPPDLPHLERQFEQLRHGVRELDEYRLRTSDGGTRWVLSSSMPLFDQKGEFRGIVGVLTDVHRGHTAEEAFRETEERFRTTFDLAGVGIAHLAPDWTWLRANETLCEIVGYSTQDLLAMRFPDITHPQDRAADVAGLDRLTQGAVQTVTREKRVLRKDGFTVSVSCTVSVMRDASGEIRYYIAIVEDITGRKRLEDTLQLLRTAVESIPLGITVANLEGRIVYVNPAEAQMHGYRTDELLGKAARMLAPADQWSSESMKELIGRNQISDVPFVREGTNVRKDGAAFPVTIHSVPVRDLRGAPLGLVSVAEDITDRKRMLDELRESELKYRTLFESANDAILITDHATGIFTDCNVQACALLGMARDEIIGMHQSRLHPPDEAERYQEWFSTITPEQRTGMFIDQVVCRKDGAPVWVDISSTLIERRGAWSLIAIIRDVTQRKMAEEQFVHWVGQLRESEERYRTLVTNISGVVYRCETAAPWKVDYISDAILSLSGYPASDFLAGRKHFGELIVPEDAPRVERAVAEAVAADRPFEIEYRIARADGSVRWVFERGVPVQGPAERLPWLDGVILDITEHKQAEEGKLQAERRYRTLVDNSLVGVFISSVGGEILYVNEAHARLAGYDSPRDMMRVKGKDLYLRSSDREHLLDALRKHGRVSNFEFEHLRKDGSTMTVLISASLDGDTISGMMMDISARKAYEQKLKESETRFRETADLLPQPVFETDMNGMVTFANRSAFAQFGYADEDIVNGMNVFHMLVPQDRERAQQYVGRLIQGGTQIGNEYTAQRKDGSTFPVVIYSAPVLRDGVPSGIRGVVLDISDRKRAEEDNRIRAAILEVATDAVLLVDMEGKLLYFNDALCRMTGYSHAELASLRLQDIEPPEYAARVLPNLQSLQERGEAVFDSAYLRKDGAVVLLEVNARVTEYGGSNAVLSVVRDVTDRKRTEEILAMAKQDWESTFDTITDMITIHDENFNIIRSNKAAADILGLPWIKMGRAKCYEFYHGTAAPPESCPSCESLRTKQPSIEERYEPHLRKYLEIRAIPRIDDSGRVRGLIHVVRDITARRKAEEERVQLEARLRDAEKLEVIGSLAGGVAHEVRNPLNAIMALTDALDREVGGNPEYHTFMHHMRTQVERLSALMTDLLELGKPVDRSRLRTERLSEICTLSIDAWKQSKWGRGHEVALTGMPVGQDLLLEADGKKLQQVFINLLDNAAQHSEEGSPIAMEVLKGNGGTAWVRIIDRGSGIPEDILPKVFDTFFTTRRGGTGLGLSIVKHIVDIHGGAISMANNDPPPGCTATVILPIKEDAAS